MLYLTAAQHREIVQRLRDLARSRAGNIPHHSAGIEYTSLMVCFFLQRLSAAETLLRLADSFDHTWFPVTIGYAITRTMFETDVTAHYITQDPEERARQCIDFAHVLNKRSLDACSKHRNSRDAQWREAMDLVWQNHWASRERKTADRFTAIAPQFTRTDRRGRSSLFQNWSGKSIRKMALEVDHLEAYDVFYSELSSFTHGDVHAADRFLRHRPEGVVWSQRAEEADVGNVFRHAASFLTCYLELFGRQFGTWTDDDVQRCWQVGSEAG